MTGPHKVVSLGSSVVERITDSGVGPVSLLGAISGSQRVIDTIGAGVYFPYVIRSNEDPPSVIWEEGIGIIDASSLLTRETVLQPVYDTPQNLPAGEKLLLVGPSAAFDFHVANGPPGPTDDNSQGFAIACRWIESIESNVWVLVDDTPGAAVWRMTGPNLAFKPNAFAGTVNLNFESRLNHAIDPLTANITIEQSKASIGQTYQVEIQQDATGGRAVTWGTTFDTISWAEPPSPSLAANERDLYSLSYREAGRWHGFQLMKGF